jgi:nitroreductase
VSTTVLQTDQIDDKLKWADTDPRVIEVIRARWSPRAFSQRPIAEADLKLVLEAARWAASSYNEQPWRFFVARRSDPHFPKFLSILSAPNQLWAKDAQVLMFIAYKKTFTHNGSPNRYGLHDAGQAFANLALQATALGFHVHGMAGFDNDRARKELAIPDDFGLGAAVAIGYAGSPEQLPEQYRTMETAPRVRKPLADIAFGSGWNDPAGL